MSAKESVYAALPPDADVVRAHRDGRLGPIVAGALQSCPESAEAYAALIHYLLSVLGVPSQRKVESSGVRIDVVVPDLRTLRRRPPAALVLCITGAEGAPERALEAARIQPDARNVWMACPSAVPGYRTFSGPGIAELPAEAAGFLEKSGSGKIRILGSRS